MLRAVLLTSPLVLSVVISCGDSSPTFDDSNLNAGSGGTDTSQSGATAAGTTSNQAGSMASAGSNSGGGTKGNGGAGNGAGNGNGGGTKGNGGNGNPGGGSNGGGGNPGGGTTANDGGMPNAGAPTEPMAGMPGAGMPGAAGAPNPPGCPDVFGAYDVVNADGMCDGLGKNAPQLIQGTDVACFAHFVSIPVSGNPAVNGGAALDENGNFSGSKLFFGNKERQPCSGVWDQVEERMTVKCGGAADQCTVVLDRQ
jgi:hypothetical protein